MIRFFKELYFTCFTLFYRVGIYRWSLPVEIAKAVACVTLVEAFILMGISALIEMYFGTRFLLNEGKWAIGIAYLALCLPNYYVLAIRGDGIKFEREFTHLKKSRKNLLVASFVGLMLAVVIFFIYTVTAYHRFFHIIPKSGF